jgi:hypothetical protein
MGRRTHCSAGTRPRPSLHVRIDVDDPAALAELSEILRASGCAVLESGPLTLHVTPPGADRQADIELLLFVRAWAQKRTGIVVTLESSTADAPESGMPDPRSGRGRSAPG